MRKIRVPFEEISVGQTFELRGETATKVDENSAEFSDPGGAKAVRKPIPKPMKVVVTAD